MRKVLPVEYRRYFFIRKEKKSSSAPTKHQLCTTPLLPPDLSRYRISFLQELCTAPAIVSSNRKGKVGSYVVRRQKRHAGPLSER